MRKLLLQLDSSRLPSVFDQVVAYDAGADVIMSYGGVVESDVRDLIHGCLFTRGPKDLPNTAVWIGGSNMSAGEHLLAVALVVGELAPADSPQSKCAAELRRLCEQKIMPEHKYDIAINLAECLPWLQCQANHRVQQAIETVMANRLSQPD